MGPIYIALFIALSTIIILGVYAVLFAPIDMFLHLQGVDTFYQRSSTSFMGAPPLSPPGWPQAVLLGFVALPAIFGIYAGLAAAWYNLRHEPRNTNVYFDDTELHDIVSELKATGRGAVVESLVISAGILDEALLAISSGPLVQGVFTPAVHNIVGRIGQIRWSPSLEAWEPPSYKSKDLYSLDLVGYGKASHDFIYAAYALFLMVVRNCFLGIVYPANWLFRKASEKYVINTLGKVVRAATYGLPPTAFSSASSVVVSHRSQLEQYVREDFWDVARLLTRYPARTIKRNGSNDLYAFYWNEALLEERMRASWLRKRLKLPLDDLDRYEADIRLICLTIEDRLKGFAGLAELTHSQYYSNGKVIEQIAHFLACGKHLHPPEGCRTDL